MYILVTDNLSSSQVLASIGTILTQCRHGDGSEPAVNGSGVRVDHRPVSSPIRIVAMYRDYMILLLREERFYYSNDDDDCFCFFGFKKI